MPNHLLLQPVVALLLLTLAIAICMAWTRVKAMKTLRIHPQKGDDTSALKPMLPREVSRISDNYNHLFEQPVAFYVTCFAIIGAGVDEPQFVALAWAFVCLRVAHSVVQICIAKVLIRFALFLVSWLVLGAMIISLAWRIF